MKIFDFFQFYSIFQDYGTDFKFYIRIVYFFTRYYLARTYRVVIFSKIETVESVCYPDDQQCICNV